MLNKVSCQNLSVNDSSLIHFREVCFVEESYKNMVKVTIETNLERPLFDVSVYALCPFINYCYQLITGSLLRYLSVAISAIHFKERKSFKYLPFARGPFQ